MLPENAIALDARLSAIRALAGSCARFADIGADHGRLGAHMLLHDFCARAQLADISAASLIKARRLIYGLGLTDRVDFCVGDGAQALKERPDVAVIAGMGGQTIAGIVERGLDMLSDARLILQPNVAAPELRARLQAAGFCIEDEAIARDGRRLYVILVAKAGEMLVQNPEKLAMLSDVSVNADQVMNVAGKFAIDFNFLGIDLSMVPSNIMRMFS